MALEIRRQPRLHHPDMALVGEHDALRRAGRARRVQEHRGLAIMRHDGREAPRVEETIETIGSIAAEMNRRQVGWNVRAARHIAEHQLCAGIAEDEMDGVAGEFEIHRHRNQARAHDAEIGGEVLGAIGREDGNAIATYEAALDQRAGDSVRHGVEPRVAELARDLLATEIDDGDLAQVAVASDEIAEVSEVGHGQLVSRMRRGAPQPEAMPGQTA